MYTSFYNPSERGGTALNFGKTSKKQQGFKPMFAGSSDHQMQPVTDAILYINQRLHNDKMVVSEPLLISCLKG